MSHLPIDLEAAFHRAALEINFPNRYYDICKRHSPPYSDKVVAKEDVSSQVSMLPAKFKRYKKESAYRCEEPLGSAVASLTFGILGGSMLEVIIGIKAHNDQYGHSFPGLALDAATSVDPDFVPDPKYPKPVFRTREQLTSILSECWQLYIDFKSSMLVTAPPLFESK